MKLAYRVSIWISRTSSVAGSAKRPREVVTISTGNSIKGGDACIPSPGNRSDYASPVYLSSGRSEIVSKIGMAIEVPGWKQWYPKQHLTVKRHESTGRIAIDEGCVISPSHKQGRSRSLMGEGLVYQSGVQKIA